MTKQMIWPLSVRLIHWAVALTVVLNAFILEVGDDAHRYLGYFAVVIILVRVGIGIFGKGLEAFSALPLAPREIGRFAGALLKGKHLSYPGHNPMASLTYIAIWLMVIGLGVSGWLMGLDRFWGNETLEDVHEILSNVLLGLVVIHLLGVILDSVVHKRKTWMAMISGKISGKKDN